MSLTWKLYEPPGGVTDWLNELREMRARSYHAEGCPGFRLPNGIYADPDPLDSLTHHLAILKDVEAVGGIRLACLGEVWPCLSEKILGEDHEKLQKSLEQLNISRENVGELSRWAIAEAYQNDRWGMSLVGGIIALARVKGHRAVIGSASTRKTRCKPKSPADMWIKIGARPMPHLEIREVPEYNDRVQFLCLDLDKVDPGFERLVNKMAVLLRDQLAA
jgi:hypothetical protein